MKGTNEVYSQALNDNGDLLVNKLFYTIQGEGPDAGRPAIFLRLARCNLRCTWCDTDFEFEMLWEIARLVDEITALSKKHDCHLLVVTGGEPLLQNIIPLVKRCNENEIAVSIETAGTVTLPKLHWFFSPTNSPNKIICSPKTPKLNPELVQLVHSFKYVVGADDINPIDGFPRKDTQRPGYFHLIFRPTADVTKSRIFLQPRDDGDPAKNHANLVAAAQACMKHGYRLSVQLHKLAELE